MFKMYLEESGVDIAAIQQLNICWSHLAHKEKIWDRFRGWKESHRLTSAYNRREKSRTYFQPGGTAMIAINKISHSWDSAGVDDAKLGRYSWMRFKGSYGRHFRVVTLYRPVYSNKHNSAYMQQYRYSMQYKKGKCPRDLVLEDLQKLIQQWKDNGDGVIVLGDFNEDVRSPTITCWRERLGLYDVMLDRLDDVSLAPPTYQRGRNPIDTILCTPGIEVIKAGYLPFGTGVGDHRPLYVDITTASTLGVNLPSSRKIIARRLKLQDPRIVRRYNEKLKHFFSRYSLSSKVQSLQARITQPLSTPAAMEYENLDRIRIKGMQYAEKHCRKLRMGGIPWTPELTDLKLTIEVWQLVLRRMKGCFVSARTIIRKKHRAKMNQVNTNVTIEMAEEKLKVAFGAYKEYIAVSADKRQSFIHNLAQAKAKQGKLKVSKQLEIMQQQEEQRQSAARIRRMTGLTKSSKGIHKVIVATDSGEMTEVTDKSEMEQELLKTYEVTLTQSNRTPCMLSPLKEQLGSLGNGAIVSDLLLGNITTIEGVDESTMEVLKYLSLKDGTQACHTPRPLLVTECQDGWRKTKERISSAMVEGTHYGHWKAGHTDKDIAAVHTGLANVAFLSGYSLARWQYGVNSLIPKEEGNYNINRLRTILLYEADFNFNNKLLGKRMMESAEDDNVLAREQYGSRKSMSANVCALNKCLMFDISRQLKRSAGICSCDLHSCYDRVVHSFASVAMQRAGAPMSAIESMFSTIQQLKHVVRTCHGDSTQSFGGESWREINPLQGVGQGNGASPAIWAVISSVFFDLLRDKGYGFHMEAPLSKLSLHLAGCGFVDDTDILQIGLEDDDYITVTQKLQEAVKWWETCARVSGGAVVPKKSWYGLIDFEWIDGEWYYATDMDDVALLVKDAKGLESPLTLLKPSEAKRMLGVFLAFDGSNDIQIQHMRRIAEEWYDKVRTGHLTRRDAWTALNTTILKTLEYPLLASTLTKADCSYIMAPVLQGGLSKMGVCKSVPRALVYGPTKFMGLDIHNLYTTQGLSHLKAVLDHCWKNTETGKLLRTSIEITKVETGLRGSLWSYDFGIYGHLCEDTWVKHLWRFLWESGIKLADDHADFDYVRENDSCITAGFATAYINGRITKSDWYKANRCRLYLQCLTLGDIATGNGKSIDTNVFAGIKVSCRARDIVWPAQGNPKRTDWAIWRKLLRLCFMSTNNDLLSPLACWLPCCTASYKANWEWWWDSATQKLLRYHNGSWYQFQSVTNKRKRSNAGRRFKYYHPMATSPDIKVLQRTSVTLVKGCYTTQGSAAVRYVSEAPTESLPSLESFITALLSNSGELWAVHEVMTTDDISNLVLDIANGTAICVSDGSYKDECGTASWIIESKDRTQRIQGKVAVPGYASDQSAYRSELAGLYGIVFVIETLVEVYCITHGGVSIGCDGLSALQQSVTTNRSATSAQQHFDLISGIQGYIAESKISYLPIHIEGHQDATRPLKDLDRMAILNIECDAYAKEYWVTRTHNGTVQARAVLDYSIPKGIWKVSLQGTRICTHLVHDLRESIEGGTSAEYWIAKRKISTASFFRVDWSAVKCAMQSSPVSRRHWVTKFNSGFCSTGRMMKLWKQRIIDTCPRCGMTTETPMHILTCPSAQSNATWEKSMITFADWLVSARTCPDIRDLLCHALQQWHDRLPVFPLHNYEFDGMLHIYEDQGRIGWQNLLFGFISVEWASVQDKYYKWLGVKRSGKRWVSMLIKKLWDVAWDQWDDRNGALHCTPLADDLSGAASLDAAIQAECNLGYQGLPLHVQCTFPRDVQKLLQTSLHERKCWLQLVRAARELMNDGRITDVFSDPKSYLRRWLGLHSPMNTQE